jgi:hypothetical protein
METARQGRRTRSPTSLGRIPGGPPRRRRSPGESQRRIVESPWSQLTSECQRCRHPPRLNHSRFDLILQVAARGQRHAARLCGRAHRAAARWADAGGRQSAGAASVASFVAAVLSEIYLCNVCSCQEILRRNGRGQSVRGPIEVSVSAAEPLRMVVRARLPGGVPAEVWLPINSSARPAAAAAAAPTLCVNGVAVPATNHDGYALSVADLKGTVTVSIVCA